MNRFCPSCQSVLSEHTSSGTLLFKCGTCSFMRDANPNETLRYEHNNIRGYENNSINADILMHDEISVRIKIDCKCGSKLGTRTTIGDEMNVICICKLCGENYN